MKQNDIAMIGLAVMGRSLALNMADHGYRVAAYNRSYETTEEMMQKYPHEKITPYQELETCVSSLKRPRIVMLMVKAGKPVDQVIEQLIPLLEEGDILIDGGNSYFGDTIRREAALRKRGLLFFGVGISGGEEGARRGPSIMPGGDKDAYEHIRSILEEISAKAPDQGNCCTYIGENGAGHYVKMVHNGIEYADMQLIAEAYLLLKHVGGLDNRRIGEIFQRWKEGELDSFLIRITADIFLEADDLGEGELLDQILDSAAQKGTGRWASMEALKQGVDISMITASCNARVMSNHIRRRMEAGALLPSPGVELKKEERSDRVKESEDFVEDVRRGLYAAKIIAYSQGFDLLRNASELYDWHLPLGEIASIFQAGCIIQARFLGDIRDAYQRDGNLSHLLLDECFSRQVADCAGSLRKMAAACVLRGIPVPSMSNAVAYLDSFTASHVGANLIQAQRDYFGAHTYQRIDREGSFHHEWGKRNG